MTSTNTENINQGDASELTTLNNVEDSGNTDSETESDENTEFTLNTVEELGNLVRVTDSDETTGLQLYCYVKCDINDKGPIRECRGIVFHGPDIIMKAFPYAPEYNEYQTEELEEFIQPILKNSAIFDAHEGALIRMFFFLDKWYISTHRKLNAFKSKWASRDSFGTLFKRALESEVENNAALRESMPENDKSLLEKFQDTLDVDKQYMFLIRNNKDNRIVSQPPDRPTLYHVGTFVNGTLSTDIDCNIPIPDRHSFETLDDLRDYVANTNYHEKQGVIIFAPNNHQFKIVNSDYQDLFQARGNEPSIKFRYLQVRLDNNMVGRLCHLYPDMLPKFDEYENTIYIIANFIYKSYVSRYIHKEHIIVPPEEFNIMKTCHTQYLSDRANNKITLDRVINVINQQTPTSINHMIRHSIENDKKNAVELVE